MSLHIQTGNRLDVVVKEDGTLALQPWHKPEQERIPLRDPEGLLRVLADAVHRMRTLNKTQ